MFVDQSYWQSSVAAKPKEGVWGFLSGGLSWFAVPFTFATTMGLAYIALGEERGASLLTDKQVNSGTKYVLLSLNIGVKFEATKFQYFYR